MLTRNNAPVHTGEMRHRYAGFGARLVEAYKKAGYNRHAFATALGVAYTTVIAWERESSTPEVRSVERISDLLGVPASWLLYGDADASDSAGISPTLRAFLSASPDVTEDERRHLESVWLDFEPDSTYWQQLLLTYRLARRVSSAPPPASLVEEGVEGASTGSRKARKRR